MMMNGFQFTPTWVLGNNMKSNGQAVPRHPSLDMSYQFQAERFHAAPFEPAHTMEASHGNQNSATLAPLNPMLGGIFGPVFGFLGPDVCQEAYSVGPIAEPPRNRMFRGGAGFPDPAVGRCPGVQDLPYY